MAKRDHATTPETTHNDRRVNHTDPDAIAKRAYELFLQRGSVAGNEVDDWLQAEAELKSLASGPQVSQAAMDQAPHAASDEAGQDGARNIPDARAAAPVPAAKEDGKRGERDRGGGRRSARQQPSR